MGWWVKARRCGTARVWVCGQMCVAVGGGVCGLVDEGALLMGWRLWSRDEFVGGKGEMDRRVLEEVLGRRAAQEAQQVGQKSLVKRNFAV